MVEISARSVTFDRALVRSERAKWVWRQFFDLSRLWQQRNLGSQMRVRFDLCNVSSPRQVVWCNDLHVATLRRKSDTIIATVIKEYMWAYFYVFVHVS